MPIRYRHYVGNGGERGKRCEMAFRNCFSEYALKLNGYFEKEAGNGYHLWVNDNLGFYSYICLNLCLKNNCVMGALFSRCYGYRDTK